MDDTQTPTMTHARKVAFWRNMRNGKGQKVQEQPTLDDFKQRMSEAQADLPYMDESTRVEVKNALFWMNLFISEIEIEEGGV